MTRDLARDHPTPLTAVLSGLRRLLPVVASLSSTLATLIALGEAGATIAEELDSANLRNDIASIRRLVERLERRICARCDLTPERAREVLLRPDIVRLLAEARDVYALAQYDERPERFADVLAGRAAAPAASFDFDLHLARAALQLSDDAVRFLRFLADRKARSVFVSEQPRLTGPIEERSIAGEATLRHFLILHQLRNAQHGHEVVMCARQAESSGLVLLTSTMVRSIDVVTCADGTNFRLRTDLWTITEWGEEFLRRVHAADVPYAPIDGGGGAATSG